LESKLLVLPFLSVMAYFGLPLVLTVNSCHSSSSSL
jgi:hypothetical protein